MDCQCSSLPDSRAYSESKRASGAPTPKARALTHPVSSVNVASSVQGHPSMLCDVWFTCLCKQAVVGCQEAQQCFPSMPDVQGSGYSAAFGS